MALRYLADTTASEPPSQESVQQIIESEHGRGQQGISRTWQAADSANVVLTSDAAGVKISRDAGSTAPTQVVVDGTPAGGHLSGTYPNPSLSQAVMDLLCPVGTVIAYAAAGAAPTGWLSCDGSVQAISSYPRLASVLGTTYGGNGTTTFGLPNLNGAVPLGVSGTHPLGTTGGSETAAGPAHTHPQTHAHGMSGHLHGFDHNHNLNSHIHDMNGHGHATNLDHDHLVLPATAAASTGGSTGIHEGTVPAPTTLDILGHTHAVSVNLPPLGTLSVRSAIPVDPASGTGLPNTGVANPTTTPNLSAVWTSAPQASGGTSIPNTASDTTANGATFTTSIPTMPPYLAMAYLIRTGQ